MRGSGQPKITGWAPRLWWQGLELLPLLVPVALAAFGTVAVLLLVMNQFRTGYVWMFGLLAAAAAAGLVIKYGRSPTASRERRWCNLALAGLVVLWLAANLPFSAQHIYTDRDPATYANAGIWLIHHDNLKIPNIQIFKAGSGLASNSAGFGTSALNHHQVYAQGNHLLPALLGISGRLVGIRTMLHLNVLFGGTALLALYAFARLLVRPRWALLAVATCALSLPLMYFARDTYSEPLAMTFTFAALSLFWLANERQKLGLWLLAGLTAGAGILTRIDGYITVAMLVLSLAVWAALASAGRKRKLTSASLFVIGAAVPAVIGFLDAAWLSSGYYHSERHSIHQEIALTLLILVLAIPGVIIARRTAVLAYIDHYTRAWRRPALLVLVVLATLALLTRPLWQQTHVIKHINGVVQPPRRTWHEYTFYWVIWYLGPVLALFGMFGIALAGLRAMLSKDRLLRLLPSLLVVVATATLYLYNPNIAADQIWASRRLLPVIMPGLAVYGVLGLQWLYEKRSLPVIGWRVPTRALVILLAIVAIISPLVISRPFLKTRNDFPQLSQLQAVCAALPPHAVVVWMGLARLEAVQPTRDICGQPSQGMHQTATPRLLAGLAAQARQRGYTLVMGTYGNQTNYFADLPGAAQLKPVSSITYAQLQRRHRPPTQTTLTTRSIVLASVGSSGNLQQL